MAKSHGMLLVGLVVILIIGGIFIFKKMRGKATSAPPMPSMDAIVQNNMKAVQQAHAARLSCSSCGG